MECTWHTFVGLCPLVSTHGSLSNACCSHGYRSSSKLKAHPLEISVHISQQYIVLIAKRLSARQLILHRISPSVCIYVCVTLRNANVSRLIRNANVSRLGMQFYCKHVFKMASYKLHGCHLCTSGAQRTKIRTNRSLLFTQVGLLQLQRD